jgi:hypothetical protein
MNRQPNPRNSIIWSAVAILSGYLVQSGPPASFRQPRAGFGPWGERRRPGPASILGGRARRRQQPQPPPRGSRWPPALLALAGSAVHLPRWPPAWPPTAVRQHINPKGAVLISPTSLRCTLPFPYQRNKLSKLVLGQRTAAGGGVSQLTRCRPRASLDWTPGSTTPQRWNHDGVHSLADALSPVLIQAVRDTPRR